MRGQFDDGSDDDENDDDDVVVGGIPLSVDIIKAMGAMSLCLPSALQ